jgi:hypothetical protein
MLLPLLVLQRGVAGVCGSGTQLVGSLSGCKALADPAIRG